MDSPRGRILLIKRVLEGELDRTTAAPFIDNCLGCQSCATACRSGVEYGDLITACRAWDELQRTRPALARDPQDAAAQHARGLRAAGARA
jgi:glycolate dehydrogenase iron-sulfur subunit